MLDFLTIITQFLSQHSVPTALLVECPSTVVAATAAKLLHPISGAPFIHLSLFQPLNIIASFSAALGLLALPSSQISVIELRGPAAAAAMGPSSLAPECSMLKLDIQLPSQQLLSLSLLHIATTIKRASGALCVGTVMKSSRQQGLTTQSMLPFLPTDGVFFLPVDLNLPISTSLVDIIDLVLHKPTDFLERDSEAPLGAVPHFKSSILSFIDRFSPSCVVDPLPAVTPVLDRAEMAAALAAACTAARKLAIPVRTPAWHLIDRFAPDVFRAAAASGVSTPCVVKPIVACGVPESHQMAFILHASGLLPDLDVPLPAILQEYIDHSSTLWKVYVAGNKVFTAQKRSTPDLQPLKEMLGAEGGSLFDGGSLGLYSDAGISDSGAGGGGGATNDVDKSDDDVGSEIPTSIEFDSLTSLPTSLPWLRGLDPPEIGILPGAGVFDPGAVSPEESYYNQIQSVQGQGQVDRPWAAVMRPEFLSRLADVLRRQLGLTLFGFDVVFDYAAGEAVVLDLNFFPSYKGIPEAPEALRAALLQRWQDHKETSKV